METNYTYTWELLPAHKPSMAILTIGASGTGKSALINGLVGLEVASEGGETLFTQTRQLTRYQAKKQDSDVEIWDSPGMEVANESAELEQLVNDIQEKVRAVDVILFCINMTSARFRQGDHQNVKAVNAAFGESIWKNTVFVLTFANLAKPPPSRNDTAPIDYFNERLLEWKREIQAVLKKSGVSSVLVQSIKIVPAGYHDKGVLPGKANNWLNEFWHTCLEVTSEGTQVTLNASMDRLKAETATWHQVEKSLKVRGRPIISSPSKKLIIVGIIAFFTATSAWIAGGTSAIVIGGILLGVMCGLAYSRWSPKEL